MEIIYPQNIESKSDFPEDEVFEFKNHTTYLILPKDMPKAAILVDPTLCNLQFLPFDKLQKRLLKIWITHPHIDHFNGAMEAKKLLIAQIICHQKIAELKQEAETLNYSELSEKYKSEIPFIGGKILAQNAAGLQKLEIDKVVEDGTEEFSPLKIISTCGHSPCDTLLFGKDFIFSGDIIFIDNQQIYGGAIDLPGSIAENESQQRDVLIDCVNQQNPDFHYFPGHYSSFSQSDLESILKKHNN